MAPDVGLQPALQAVYHPLAPSATLCSDLPVSPALHGSTWNHTELAQDDSARFWAFA
jgi:hypothetical protein